MSEETKTERPWKDPAWIAFAVCSLATVFLQADIVGATHWSAKFATAILNGGSLIYLMLTRQSFPGVKFWQYKKVDPGGPRKDKPTEPKSDG